MSLRNLFHPDRLEHRIHRIRVEARLKLGKQFAGDGGDVDHTRHGQQDLLGAGVKGDLKGFGEAPHRHDRAAQAHVAHDHHL